jgi:hypothetical protein
MGIFTGPNPVVDKVIAKGDALDGSTVRFVALTHSQALNEFGQIAFVAGLADGREGVYRADPAVVAPARASIPAPASLALLIIGVVLARSASRRVGP